MKKHLRFYLFRLPQNARGMIPHLFKKHALLHNFYNNEFIINLNVYMNPSSKATNRYFSPEKCIRVNIMSNHGI